MDIISNTKWVAISQFFKIGVQLLNIVVLARLIPPAEYGIMAMALVVTNFATLVRDLGTSAAIIQKKNLENKTINSIFWLNIIMGCGVALIIIISSPVISYLFHTEKLVYVLLLLSICFPLASSSSAHLALLERESCFKSVAFIEISSSVISVFFAILAANIGWGVYSLIVQTILMSSISTVQLWMKSGWRPDFKKGIDWVEIKGLLGFSGNLTLFNFINYFSRNMDSMIIGRYMSSSILGAYSLAYRLMLFPIQNLTFVVNRALFPVISRYQDDNKKLKESYLNTLFYILMIVIPLMTGLAILNEAFVNLVFGHNWSLTASILVWLAPTGIIQAMLSTTGTVFMAKARTDVLMRLGIIGAVLQISAFILGSQYNIITFSKFYFFANVMNFFPVMYCVMKCLEGNLLDVFKKISPLALCALILAISLKLMMFNMPYFIQIDNFVKLLSISLIGGGVYVISVMILNPQVFKSIRNYNR
ncbi:lipopolysaccharide biosynthesis protein [Klebsiella michiganensis]|uniref:lipopolysaccharide biosynthesis protein n=5 Tax=Klebsiella michiganensis TaxID=1134687 RepID=UPI0007CD251C|nr:lipopolysaccharide biosynthesis protein [Klebsiella michiganensis]SAQ01945.1 polysaccharide biosynthesis protein [Klebsiella michiganensis]HBM3019362.1 lipopolysaccharide biosynthesis protein [Klebsiella michiganensis]HCC7078462.1 lipopolysaccharide biosynthesis protein [Klebsiella michiganensis]